MSNSKPISPDFNNALIFFDTSSLLDLYDYNEESIISFLERIAVDCTGRIYLSSYVKIEYDRHRTTKIHSPLASYDQLVKKSGKDDGGFIQRMNDGLAIVESAIDILDRYTKNTEKHPYISEQRINALKQIIIESNGHIKSEISNVLGEIQIQKNVIQKRKDYLNQWITKHIQVGREYSFSEYVTMAKTAHGLYEFEFPPGYKDVKEKTGIRRYADYIIWQQMIEIAHNVRRPVIFVLNDLKEDWCYQSVSDPKRIERPREELTYEFKEATGQQIVLLSLSQFLFEASLAFQYDVSKDLLKPPELIKSDVATVDFKIDNSQSGFGILHFYEGRFDISTQNIVCRLNQAKFVNQRSSIEFRLVSLRLCLGFEQNGRWVIRLRGERLNLDLNLVPSGEVIVINVDLDLNINEITALKDNWIVFELESKLVQDPQYPVGTTYTHWHGLNS